jgi:hypothetical protein
MEFQKRTTNKMKHNSILQYLSNREVGNVSANRRYDLKFALNMCTELALYHYNDVFQKQLIYHLNKIIDCTNARAIVIINFLEELICDVIEPCHPDKIDIVFIYFCTRSEFVKYGKLKKMKRIVAEQIATDLLKDSTLG